MFSQNVAKFLSALAFSILNHMHTYYSNFLDQLQIQYLKKLGCGIRVSVKPPDKMQSSKVWCPKTKGPIDLKFFHTWYSSDTIQNHS